MKSNFDVGTYLSKRLSLFQSLRLVNLRRAIRIELVGAKVGVKSAELRVGGQGDCFDGGKHHHLQVCLWIVVVSMLFCCSDSNFGWQELDTPKKARAH